MGDIEIVGRERRENLQSAHESDQRRKNAYMLFNSNNFNFISYSSHFIIP
jgi:hypothetical protein